MAESSFDVQEYKNQVFGNTIPQPETVQTIEPTQTVVETKDGDIGNANNIVENQQLETAPIEEVASEYEEIDEEAYLKQYLGYDNLKLAKADIEEYHKLKSSPTTQEPSFADEQSRRMYDLLRNGKTKEVKDFLHAQEILSNVDTLTDEQQLKLFIKMNNPKFDDELTDYKYRQLYQLDENSFINDEGEIDPLRQRLAKSELAQRFESDLQKAQEYFAQYKTKLDLPDISAPATQQEQEAAYQQALQEQERIVTVWRDSLSRLSESDIPFKFNFNDEANKIKFDVDFKMDKEGFEKARAAAAIYGEYAQQTYATQDGSPIADKLIRDIYVAQNLDKIGAEINKQAVNATIKWFLSNQKNISEDLQKNYNVQSVSEIEILKKAVFGK